VAYATKSNAKDHIALSQSILLKYITYSNALLLLCG